LTVESEAMNFRKTDTIGFIVARNLQAASVFNSYDIDFYSQGNRTLQDACVEDNLSTAMVMEELFDLKEHDPDFNTMDIVALSTYILRTHHKFTERKLVFIKHTIDRLIRIHGEEHEGLREIRKTFEELSVYLTVHMKHEEFIVFPFIQKMFRSAGKNDFVFRAIESPISSMIADHDYEVSTLRKLARLTDHYTVTRKADYSEKITYGAMKELDEDLKMHMHLENNILFPRATDFARGQHRVTG
jgi:regulator of cell morphogenesis and NO signaling